MTSEPDASNNPSSQPAEEEYILGDEIDETAEVSARDAAVRRLASAVSQLHSENHPDRSDGQVPLRYLFQLFIAASILLAIDQVLPRGVFAGVLGVVGLVWLVVDAVVSMRSVRVELAWWTLMVTYLLAIVHAMMGAATPQ